MKTQVYQFTHTSKLVMSSSFGVIATTELREIEFEIGIFEDKTGGYFTLDGGDEDWYAEGSLEFDEMYLVGYDGVFELSSYILDYLETLGYNVDQCR